MWQSRLFWRLFAVYGCLIVGSLGLVGALILGRVEAHSQRQIEENLRARAVLVADAVRGQPARFEPVLEKRVRELGTQVGTRITLLAGDGAVVADSEEDPRRMENHAARPEVRQAWDTGFGTIIRYSTTLNRPMMYLAYAPRAEAGEIAVVRVALPLDQVAEELAWLRRLVWGAAAATGAAAMALGSWLVGRIARPLRRLTRGAERLAAGNYGHKVYAAGRDEVAVLARSFNHMSERLAVQFSQLEQDRQQLRAVLGGMVEGVIALDADQRILFANERAAHLLEFAGTSAAGRRLWEVVRQRPLQDLVRHALTGAGSETEELRFDGPASRHLTAHAARLPGSPARGVVLVLHDTTELRRLEGLRRDFAANVSHELKTPLAVIKASVETLLDGAAEDPQHRESFLQQVADQADRLHALILDLLTLSRIEAGTELFSFQAVPLAPLVASCLDRHRTRAEAKRQTLQALPPPAEAVAWADEEAVGQILENLLDNALKYTPEGGAIGVRWHAADGQVSLEVEDTGIGIPEGDLPRVFERFYRVDKARSRELGGTGLGLAIVKHLAQAMQGTVQARSRLGKGTTFEVRLPRAPG